MNTMFPIKNEGKSSKKMYLKPVNENENKNISLLFYYKNPQLDLYNKGSRRHPDMNSYYDYLSIDFHNQVSLFLTGPKVAKTPSLILL